MRVAVISDIHSNYHAFKAVIDDAIIHKVKYFIFLGDYVSDLADPQKTMDLVYDIQSTYPTTCIRGNREGYILACREGIAHFTCGSKSGSLLFTYNNLRENDISFFESLRIYDFIELEGIKVEVAHAAPDNDRECFDSESEKIKDIFMQMKGNYLLTGHSHKQYIKSFSNKTIINPGSVGVPQDKSCLSKYAILDINNGNVSCTFCEVPYNLCDVIHSQFTNGLVNYAKYWAIGVLYDVITGEEWVTKLLRIVNELYESSNENSWRLAAIELGMKFTEQEIIEFYQNSLDINSGLNI